MVKTEFSIKDLENLSDVKAHTIRIWEKRYNLLEPNRTDTNIRRYDMENLKKLLNISYLYKAGYKISKLAKMDPKQIHELIKKDLENNSPSLALETLKSAMLEFNGDPFDTTMKNLLKKKELGDVYSEVIVPFLTNTGTLWHTGTVDPAHEHFISEKIRQLLIRETFASKNAVPQKNSQEFVLFLPSEEAHEISLLYANYELESRGYPTLYLGANLPLESLKYLKDQKPEAIFVSYFTVYPEPEGLKSYIERFEELLGTKNEFWILGKQSRNLRSAKNNIKFFLDIQAFTDHLDNLV